MSTLSTLSTLYRVLGQYTGRYIFDFPKSKPRLFSRKKCFFVVLNSVNSLKLLVLNMRPKNQRRDEFLFKYKDKSIETLGQFDKVF